MNALPQDPCPLCGSTGGSIEASIAYEDIWRALADQWGATFSEGVRRRHEPAPCTTLIRCDTCALQYFSPIAPGDEGFYAELMSSIPYHADRWEFRMVRRVLPVCTRVVDLGCGAGAFLRRIAGRVARPVGVDHNRHAIAELQEAGIEAYVVDFESFARREPRVFDVVCAFHTLEHLPRVDALMGSAVACARPGARIFLSVPNRERYGRPALEPLDCPPHHISHWAPAQFEFLGKAYGLSLQSIRYEPPGLSQIRRWYVGRGGATFRSLGRADGRGPVLKAYPRFLAGPILSLRTILGERLTARGVFGPSMLGEFRVPME